MKHKVLKTVILLLTLTVVILAALTSIDTKKIFIDLGFYAGEYHEKETFTVMVRECDGISLKSDSVVEVPYGESVTFKFRVNNNYMYLGNSAGVIMRTDKGGVSYIHIDRVRGPMTIDFTTMSKSDMYFLYVNTNLDNSSVSILEGEEAMTHSKRVTISATAPKGYKFLGWSKDGYYADGARLVSRDAEYSFTTVSKKNDLYANFVLADKYEINYHLNGGYVQGSASDLYTVQLSAEDMFYLPMTIREDDPDVKFKRSGYVAVGYSTSPVIYNEENGANSIEGFCNIGGVCEVPKSTGVLDLYVVWAKVSPASDFKYEECTYSDVFKQGTSTKITKTGYVITDYVGNDKTVVIPESINGKEVIGIKEDAFLSNTTLRRVVIAKTVVKIEKFAFDGCYNLNEVVFYDSLQYVTNDSFPASIKTAVLCGQRGTVYGGSAEGGFSMKYSRVRSLSTANANMLIVLSGSSTLNGMNSAKMQEYFGRSYQVVNYGTNAATQMTFYLEVLSNYVDRGDLIVYAPEWDISATMGSCDIHWKLFRGNDQCYDIYREVDLRNYNNFFGAWQEFQTGIGSTEANPGALTLSTKPYHQKVSLNEYGDLLGSRYRTSYTNTENRTKFPYNLNDTRIKALNRLNEMITDTGATLVMSFCTKDKIGYKFDWTAIVDAETKKYADALDMPVISNIGTYIFDNELMYDSQWHATYQGANKRTYELYYDIKRFLEQGGDSYMSYAKRQQYEKNDFENYFDNTAN